MLPYFRRTEHHYEANLDFSLHDLNGPVHTASVTSSGRNYPLRNSVLAAWKELGVEEHPDQGGRQLPRSRSESRSRIGSLRISKSRP
jgi:hypothetical protein